MFPIKPDSRVPIEDFGGLWDRDTDDAIPRGHFRTCDNAVFDVKKIGRRDGISITYQLNFKPLVLFLGCIDFDRFFLLLDDTYKLHRDNGASILNMTVQNFSGLNLYNRVYISPNDGPRAPANQYLYVYTGAYNPRLAGGLAPATSLTVVVSASAGVVSKGLHKFAVSYVTDTGFITPPSNLTEYTAADSLHKVDISNIPIGPAGVNGGVVHRYILCTKAGEEELFFVPGGLIENNTATTITLSFADTDLVRSADYLNDIYDRITAGVHIVGYKGRLIVVGTELGAALVSNVADPETFSKVTGYLALPGENRYINPPVAGMVLRDTLYISKFPGVTAFQDSGDDNPSNWSPVNVDDSIGYYPNGISTFTQEATGKNTSDYAIVLTHQGVVLFDGVFRRPSISWKLDNLWRRIIDDDINNSLGVSYNFWRFTISHDIVNHKFYINCATMNPPVWFLLHGDYSGGWDAQAIRWARWVFPFYCSIASMSIHPIDNKYVLRVGGFESTKLYLLDTSADKDDGTNITMTLETGLLYKELGSLSFFLGSSIRAKGTGTFGLSFSDGITTYIPAALSINSSVFKEYFRGANYTSEKAKFAMSTISKLMVNRFDVFIEPRFMVRPQL